MLPTILDVLSNLREDDPPIDTNTMLEFERVIWHGEHRIIPAEAWSLGRGRETFLYRGQTRRYRPCFPSIFRGAPTEPIPPTPGSEEAKFRCRVMLSRARICELELILREHPFTRLAESHGLTLDYEALAQHYGIPTGLLDLTSNLNVAAFFAVAEWSRELEWFRPAEDGEGVLYRVRWLRTRNPASFFEPIGHGPASRPGRQHAWAFSLKRGVCFESCPVVESVPFRHDGAASREVMARFDGGGTIYPDECLVPLVRRLSGLRFVTLNAIKHDIRRHVTDEATVSRQAETGAVAISTELDIDVIDGAHLELEPEDIDRAEREVEALKASLNDGVGFRFVRTPKNADE
jgi:hypothetical protein